MIIAPLSAAPRWEISNKKEKNYEKLMNQPQKLGKIIANKTVKDVFKKSGFKKSKND